MSDASYFTDRSTEHPSADPYYSTAWSQLYREEHGIPDHIDDSLKEKILDRTTIHALRFFKDRYTKDGFNVYANFMINFPREDEQWLKPFCEALLKKGISPSLTPKEMRNELNSLFSSPDRMKDIVNTYYGYQYLMDHEVAARPDQLPIDVILNRHESYDKPEHTYSDQYYSSYYETPWSSYHQGHDRADSDFENAIITNTVSDYAQQFFISRYSEFGPDYKNDTLLLYPKEDEEWLIPFCDNLINRGIKPTLCSTAIFETISSLNDDPEAREAILRTYHGIQYRKENGIDIPVAPREIVKRFHIDSDYDKYKLLHDTLSRIDETPDFHETVWSQKYKESHPIPSFIDDELKERIISSLSGLVAFGYNDRYSSFGNKYELPYVFDLPKEDEKWMKPLWDKLLSDGVPPQHCEYEIKTKLHSLLSSDQKESVLNSYYGNEYRKLHNIPLPLVNSRLAKERYYVSFDASSSKDFDTSSAEERSDSISHGSNVDDFFKELNTKTLSSLANNTCFWMHNNNNPIYCKNPFTNRVYRDENQFFMQLVNRENNENYINYAPLNTVINKRPHWLRGIQNKLGLATVAYMGKDENGNKKYMFTMPTKVMNQNVIQEDPLRQEPVESVPPINFDKEDRSDIGKYFINQVAQYFNCAFTKRPFEAGTWTSSEREQLSNLIRTDPLFISRATREAFRLSTDRELSQTRSSYTERDFSRGRRDGSSFSR